MTKEEILLSLHTLVHAFSDHKRREAVRELHREAANLFDQQAKRIEELEGALKEQVKIVEMEYGYNNWRVDKAKQLFAKRSTQQ